MNPKKRSKARELALQAIYQWQLTQHSVAELTEELQVLMGMDDEIDFVYFQNILQGVIQYYHECDDTIQNYSALKLDQLEGVERAVLRLATFELNHHLDIPYRVIINEALELTKRFGTVDGFKYVNGVLDKVARAREYAIDHPKQAD